MLGTRCHAVGLVENDKLLASLGERHFLLGEAFNAVAYDIDTCGSVVSPLPM